MRGGKVLGKKISDLPRRCIWEAYSYYEEGVVFVSRIGFTFGARTSSARSLVPRKEKASAFEKPFARTAITHTPRLGALESPGPAPLALTIKPSPRKPHFSRAVPQRHDQHGVVVVAELCPREGTGRRCELLSRSREGSVGQRLPNTRGPR